MANYSKIEIKTIGEAPSVFVEVLVDGFSKTDEEMLTGYTKHNKLVNFKGSEDLIGKIVQVKVKKAFTWHLLGELI